MPVTDITNSSAPVILDLMKRYNPKEIEPRWEQAKKDKIYEAQDKIGQTKKYILECFLYPQWRGPCMWPRALHTIGDAVALRTWLTTTCCNPMGWDAVCRPENYAIKNNISPSRLLQKHRQVQKPGSQPMALKHDWSRGNNQSDPDYYKLDAVVFLMLRSAAWLYQKTSVVVVRDR